MTQDELSHLLGDAPSPAGIEPPITPRVPELPLGRIEWVDFERLCARLVRAESQNLVHVNRYGQPGDYQAGIDILAVRRVGGRDEAWVFQCKRHKQFGPAAVREAARRMREYPDAERRVLMLSCPAGEKEESAAREAGILLWDSKVLGDMLKAHPALVTDFFGPMWADAFCGPARVPAPFTAIRAPDHFVGRTDELKALAEQLVPGGAAVIQGGSARLVGLGGLGKTALAACAAHALRDHFPDGVLWADLAHRTPDDILTEWAALFGVDLASYPALVARADAVRTLLSDKQLLVILDDARDDAALAMLKPAGCPALLVTTRRTDLDELRDIRPLPLPSFSPPESKALFRAVLGEERWTGVGGGGGDLGEGDEGGHTASPLRQIHELLGGLPLALSLAAAAVAETGWPLAYYADQVRANPLHDKLAAAFELSVGLLTPDERRFFACLGAFGGPDFDPAAAVMIATVPDAEHSLERLRALSLLEPARPGRYSLHPLLRVYARRAMPAEAEGRMADYFTALARREGARLDGPEIDSGLAVLDIEWDNVRAAWEWARAQENEAGWKLTRDLVDGPVVRYLSLRARWEDWITWSLAGLAACQHLSDERMQGLIAGNLGLVYARKGEWDRAIEFYQKDLEISERVGDIHGMASTWGNLGIVYANLPAPDYVKAEEYYHRSLQVTDAIGDIVTSSNQYANLARLCEKRGDIAATAAWLEKAVEIRRRVGHPDADANAAWLAELQERL